jgi:hypothetical protein
MTANAGSRRPWKTSEIISFPIPRSRTQPAWRISRTAGMRYAMALHGRAQLARLAGATLVLDL